MDVYRRPPKKLNSFTLEALRKKLEKNDYRIIYAGDLYKNVPLTLWFMRRVKSEMLHMNVKHEWKTKEPIEFCLNVSTKNEYKLEGSFRISDRNNKYQLYVGHSWLSQAMSVTFDYMKHQHGCQAPKKSFVFPLDPKKRGNQEDLVMQDPDKHIEHLHIQEQFLYLLTQYQAAKEAREDSSKDNRTNPQRLLDLEKEKMHIANFRQAAASLGTIFYEKPYMSRRRTRIVARGAIGMVGVHGQPTFKELQEWKRKRRKTGAAQKKADPPNNLYSDEFTATAEPQQGQGDNTGAAGAAGAAADNDNAAGDGNNLNKRKRGNRREQQKRRKIEQAKIKKSREYKDHKKLIEAYGETNDLSRYETARLLQIAANNIYLRKKGLAEQSNSELTEILKDYKPDIIFSSDSSYSGSSSSGSSSEESSSEESSSEESDENIDNTGVAVRDGASNFSVGMVGAL